MTSNILIFLLDNTLPDLPPIGTPKNVTPIPTPSTPPRKRANRAQKRIRDVDSSDELTGEESPVIDLGIYSVPE